MILTSISSFCLMTSMAVMDLDSLKNVMDGLQANMRDVEFVYEGTVINVTTGADSTVGSNFQGSFAYRFDGSVLVNLYLRDRADQNKLTREVFALSERSKLQELTFHPDRGKSSTRLQAKHGGLPALKRKAIPLRFQLIYALNELLRDSGGMRTNNHYLFQAHDWEEVSGRKCLKVEFDTSRNIKAANYLRHTYWIDLERGGHPIRYEFKVNDQVWSRSEAIVLESIGGPGGKSFWLPVSGTYRSFVKGRNETDGSILTSPKPIFEEKYFVVRGTVKFNQNLPDGRFVVNSSVPAGAASLQGVRREHEKILRQPRPSKFQARIGGIIEEADSQKRLLDASSSPYDGWFSPSMGTLAFATAGGLCLATALRMRRSR